MGTHRSTTDRADRADRALAAFEHLRGRLFGIAYRMLGNAADAEDVVQETWLRWQQTDRDEVRDPGAFLATTATRIAINVLQSARVRRAAYVGPWLPSPIDTGNDPTLGAERAEALELATLLLMERLTPAERAAYVLRAAFDYPYGRIAEILESSEAAARQLVSRARKHLESGTARTVSKDAHQRLFRAFLDAARGGDAARLETLLAADAVSRTDGGGVVHRTARRPIAGREKLIRFLCGVAQWFWDDVTIDPVIANGRDAALLRRDGRAFAVLTIDAHDGVVTQILWMMNPDKLTRAEPGASPPTRTLVRA